MAHVHCSTLTAGLEAGLDVMPLDLSPRCTAVQVACRVQGRNQSRWDGIGHSRLRGYLFWSNQLLELVGPDCDYAKTERGKIKDHFCNR